MKDMYFERMTYLFLAGWRIKKVPPECLGSEREDGSMFYNPEDKVVLVWHKINELPALTPELEIIADKLIGAN